MEKIPMTRAGFDQLDEELRELRAVERRPLSAPSPRPASMATCPEKRRISRRPRKAELCRRPHQGTRADFARRGHRPHPPEWQHQVQAPPSPFWTRTPEEERTYQIVGSEAEADLERGLLNIRSPLARALIGKDGGRRRGGHPGGENPYEILSIRYV